MLGRHLSFEFLQTNKDINIDIFRSFCSRRHASHENFFCQFNSIFHESDVLEMVWFVKAILVMDPDLCVCSLKVSLWKNTEPVLKKKHSHHWKLIKFTFFPRIYFKRYQFKVVTSELFKMFEYFFSECINGQSFMINYLFFDEITQQKYRNSQNVVLWIYIQICMYRLAT